MRSRDLGLRALRRIMRTITVNTPDMTEAEWNWLMSRLVQVEYKKALGLR